MIAILSLIAMFVGSDNLLEMQAKRAEKSNVAHVSSVAEGVSCGVLCCERIIFLAKEVVVPFPKLIHPKYISSPEGSSDTDLRKLLSDFDIPASTQTGLGVQSLAFLGSPAILHVKRDESSSSYNHWVLFLGVKNGKYMIADLPNPAVPFSSQELLSIWDGTAIVTDRETFSTAKFYLAWLLFQLAPLAALVFIPLIAIAAVARRLKPSRLTELSLTILVILAVGISRNFFLDGGLGQELGNRWSATEASSAIRILETEDASCFANSIAIDSRFQTDYYRGHVNNAVNIPVFVSRAHIRESMKGIDLDERLVVYCHSSRCSFSQTIAERLVQQGYKNIVIYTPGWVELVEEK